MQNYSQPYEQPKKTRYNFIYNAFIINLLVEIAVTADLFQKPEETILCPARQEVPPVYLYSGFYVCGLFRAQDRR